MGDVDVDSNERICLAIPSRILEKYLIDWRCVSIPIWKFLVFLRSWTSNGPSYRCQLEATTRQVLNFQNLIYFPMYIQSSWFFSRVFCAKWRSSHPIFSAFYALFPQSCVKFFVFFRKCWKLQFAGCCELSYSIELYYASWEFKLNSISLSTSTMLKYYTNFETSSTWSIIKRHIGKMRIPIPPSVLELNYTLINSTSKPTPDIKIYLNVIRQCLILLFFYRT